MIMRCRRLKFDMHSVAKWPIAQVKIVTSSRCMMTSYELLFDLVFINLKANFKLRFLFDQIDNNLEYTLSCMVIRPNQQCHH